MSEIELKVVLDDAGEARLRARLEDVRQGGPALRRQSLRTVYHDTPDHRLRKAGTALRLRLEGETWTQTVKARAAITGGLMRTEEVDAPAPDGLLDLNRITVPEIREEILAAVDGAELSPVCETRMERTSCVLRSEGGARVELAIDCGEILAGDRRAPFREAELELLQGDVSALYDLAGRLFPEGGLRLSTLPKSARGYMLAETGEIEPKLAPRKAREVPLAPEMTAEVAARDVLRECFEQITTNIDVVLHSPAPEGPHQLRIGLRRLRAAMGLFRPVIGHPEMARLGAQAKALGAAVGALRDLDVVIADVIDPSERDHASEPGFAVLREAVEARRDTTREALRRHLLGAEVQGFQIALARFIEARGWLVPSDIEQTARLAAPVGELAERALGKRWKSVRKHAHGIDHLTIEERHELRKELKKLRYSVEFMGPLYKQKAVTEFVKRMKRLQTVFGELNDLAMAEEMLCGIDSPGARNLAAQRAVGWILGNRGAHAELSWTHAKELWQDLKGKGPFWE
ncbi:CYTH and CHAD domain-containing protein [Tropicimonas sediminicola]|uniref:Inorganic triphosphatase YgiF, contains CYTH and CHAD domains n=1 Tax=Tropicimonas sediminicola TaxID=1031541 RepID=A0A239GSP0_9RHOB|nr:CYTH and CHAD domain-containing protein [Tropicimonas sediminicola]SNS72236.1 Inorganic triphosphatase YgiF, contains CYTH and CHAD domains [Tropicimonas sediminicola]